MATKKIQILGSLGVGDADTLDGMHASEFATASQLKSLVGDTAVSEQISNAMSQMSQIQIITWEDDD